VLDRPNFFLVGAPKCGTTSLYAWLKDHPNIFFPSTKEPHFFASNRPYRTVDTLAEYLAMYRQIPADALIAGDGSTTYLHSPGALENVHAFAPEAKIVIAVRNPVEMVESMHGHLLFHGSEDVEDLEPAWALSDERAQGRSLSAKFGADPAQLTYKEFGQLGRHVFRAIDLFGRSQVHIVFFEDLRSDPAGVYQDLLEFLGVPHDNRVEFQSQNVSKSHGKSFVSKAIAHIPKPIHKLLRRVGISNTGIADRLIAKTATKKEKVQLRPEFVAEMRAFFAPDVQLLESVTGRKTGW
jgi:hypothetical protein